MCMSMRRAAITAIAGAAIAFKLANPAHGEINRPGCVPIAQRDGHEVGCYIIVTEHLGQLQQSQVFWSLYNFSSRAAADEIKQPGDTVFEAVGKTWLSHIGGAGWQARGGERTAEIGPLVVKTGVEYHAVYMEAVFTPGMRANIHRHSGPEAWYTVAGETCLETPDETYLGRAGGPPVIVPEGPPMALTATGTETRKAVVLILHDASKPHTTLTSDWVPKGECEKYLRK